MRTLTKILLLFLFFINFICFAQWNRTSGFVGGPVLCLASSGPYIFAGTKYRGVFRSSDDGQTWDQTTLDNECILSLAAIGSNIVAGLFNGGLIYSTNYGLAWEQSLSSIEGVWSMAANNDVFLAGTQNGISISSDNGQTWLQTLSKPYDFIPLFALSSNCIAGTSQDGIFLSKNDGKDWNQILTCTQSIKSVALQGSKIFGGTYEHTIYGTTDLGQNWTKSDFIQRCIYSICISGSNIIVGGDNGVCMSSNNGRSWVQTLLNREAVNTLIERDTKIFCGTDKSGVYLSTNNGINWSQTTLVNKDIHEIAFEITNLVGEWTDFKMEPMTGYFAGSIISINFQNDSFYYNNIRFSDVMSFDTCYYNNGIEYSSGIYRYNDSLIHFSGYWTDKTYKNILTYGCFNIGKFELTYTYKYYSNNILELDLINPKQLPPNTTGIKTKLFLIKK